MAGSDGVSQPEESQGRGATPPPGTSWSSLLLRPERSERRRRRREAADRTASLPLQTSLCPLEMASEGEVSGRATHFR